MRGVLARQRQHAERDAEHEHHEPTTAAATTPLPPPPVETRSTIAKTGSASFEKMFQMPVTTTLRVIARVGETPRTVEAVAHADGERATCRHRVGHRGRRLAHHRRLGEREPGHHRHEHQAVCEQARDRDARRARTAAPRSSCRCAPTPTTGRRLAGAHRRTTLRPGPTPEHAAHHESSTAALVVGQHVPSTGSPRRFEDRSVSIWDLESAWRQAGVGEEEERMGRLDGKVAIVTGGSRGVGAATARVVRRGGGAGDASATSSTSAARRSQAEIGDAATYVHCDVSDEDDWTGARSSRRCRSTDGSTCSPNIAAVMHLSLIVDTTPEDYLRVTKVNELGTFMGIRAAISPMTKSGGGSIVNYASVWVVQPAPYTCAYGASKWAISGTDQVRCDRARAAWHPRELHLRLGRQPAVHHRQPDLGADERAAQRREPTRVPAARAHVGRGPSTPPAPRRRRAPACSSRATRAPGTTAPTSPPAPSSSATPSPSVLASRSAYGPLRTPKGGG